MLSDANVQIQKMNEMTCLSQYNNACNYTREVSWKCDRDKAARRKEKRKAPCNNYYSTGINQRSKLHSFWTIYQSTIYIETKRSRPGKTKCMIWLEFCLRLTTLWLRKQARSVIPSSFHASSRSQTQKQKYNQNLAVNSKTCVVSAKKTRKQIPEP